MILDSLFEEQIELESDELDRFMTEGSEISAESVTHFPELTHRVRGPEGYLKLIGIAEETARSQSNLNRNAGPWQVGNGKELL